jgi:ubiquitin carboxyl-terminal hydrolase 5/13
MADFEAVIRAQLPKLRIPGPHDRVFKSECAYSYHTTESAGGLYTNLATLVSVGAPYVALDRARTGGAVYLHTTAKRVLRAKQPAAADAGGPTKLAIGVAGGFAVNEPAFDVVSEHAVVVFTGAPGDGAYGPAVRLPHPDGTVGLPSLVTAVVDAVLAVRDTGVSESAAATWEDVPHTSKYADGLIQEASGRRISPRPADWVCGDCDKRDNLWLNLGDGHIGCGRKNWDGTCVGAPAGGGVDGGLGRR